MNVAILHYHLNRGGVTRVIQNQLLGLEAVLQQKPGPALPAALIYGGRRDDWPEDFPESLRRVRLTLHPVPSLDYDEERAGDDLQPAALAGQLIEVLDALQFAPRKTVLHVHNHAIGKNASLPGAVSRLAERGYATLLQLHDFVEDFRPANFRRLADALTGGGHATSWHVSLYPQAPHIHYIVLNGRDHRILTSAGVDAGRLHLLPNPVVEPEDAPSRREARVRLAEKLAVPPEACFVLYPVRCIRRKNVGEALLYSKLAPPGTVVGLTLPPLNPEEKPVYTAWTRLAADLELPCRLETGAPGKLSYAENLAASDLILTTSVAEGFGMVFLESWVAGRDLAGRDLPEITADFTEAGIALDRLKPRLHVPGDWVGIQTFHHLVRDAYRQTLAAYDRPQPLDLSGRLDARTKDGLVDFADLDEPLQEQVIRRVSCCEADRHRVLRCNPWIHQAFSVGADQPARIRRNAEAIRNRFSVRRIGERLLEIYERAVPSPRGGVPKPLEHADLIFEEFLQLERFRLIRSELVRVGVGG